MAARVSPLDAWREWYTSGGQIGSHERGVLMKQLLTRAIVVAALAISSLVASQSVGYASGPTVSGGGVVDGDLGTTSQLGFTASSSGGQFLCVMAGRSGGFPFGPWASVSQMQVKGPVSGPVTLSGGVASFSGIATIHVVGKTSTGEVMTATVPNVPYTSRQTAGGAGEATHRLEVLLPGIGAMSFPATGMAPLRSGRITIRP
jgi:hypothetical protein